MSRPELIPFSSMTDDERQLFIDYLYKELNRHADDILAINEDLKVAKKLYGIRPRRVFVDKRIEVGK